MSENVKCKNCNNLRNVNWCEWLVNPDPERARDCQYFQQKTNGDRIRAMNDEELAEFIRKMVDGSNSHEIGCYECIYYGTHHSDISNKGTPLYECEGCSGEGIGLDIHKWLQRPAQED